MTMASNYSQNLNKPPPCTSLTTFMNGIGDVVSAKLKILHNNVLIGSLKSLVSLLDKDVAITFPRSEEEAINKDQ
jgi:hypothetical protein